MELNELEELFIRAFVEPGVRPAFYQLLMRSDVWVFTAARTGSTVPSIVTFHRNDRAKSVPIFTSEQALSSDKPIVFNEVTRPTVARMPSRTVMERTRGLYVHINPYSQYNRDFTPDEIAWLLKDETVHFGTQAPHVSPTGMTIQLRNIEVAMPELEAALMQLFLAAPEVQCAYLVEAERAREGQWLRTLMLVAHARPSKSLTNAVSTIFSDVYRGSLHVDFCFDDGEKDFIETLRRTRARPFFDRMKRDAQNGRRH